MSIKKNKVLSLGDFVDQGPVIDRMMEVFGAKDWTEMSACVRPDVSGCTVLRQERAWHRVGFDF
jgi:hypothetical protein